MSYKKTKTRRIIEPSSKQKEYYEILNHFDLIYLIGAAGSGKTYAACSSALEYLEQGYIDRIIITRPVVAAEELGYLPGTIEEKVNPFIDPLLDIFSTLYDKKAIQDMMKEGIIETAPLAYMRGRTFNDSFIILDEAQNSTIEQIKMFLTRFGHNIKCTITGDLTQSDLFEENGLDWSLRKLKPCDLVTKVVFEDEDVVRSSLVKELIKYLR